MPNTCVYSLDFGGIVIIRSPVHLPQRQGTGIPCLNRDCTLSNSHHPHVQQAGQLLRSYHDMPCYSERLCVQIPELPCVSAMWLLLSPQTNPLNARFYN